MDLELIGHLELKNAVVSTVFSVSGQFRDACGIIRISKLNIHLARRLGISKSPVFEPLFHA